MANTALFQNKTIEEIKEVEATMALEGMDLTLEDIEMLYDYQAGKMSGDELRQRIMNEIKKNPYH